MNSSIGPVDVSWGINRWALVDTPLGSLQRQVSTWVDLADLLGEAGVPAAEAERLAHAFWSARPGDASFEWWSRNESLWRATGLPAWAMLLIAGGIVALFLLVRFAFLL